MVDKIIPREEYSGLLINSASGNLHLTGWNKDEFRIKDLFGFEGEKSSISIKDKKGQLEISSVDDLIIHLPHNVPVVIKSAAGDANLRGILGAIEIESIAGDLNLRDVGSLTIKNAMGDLIATRVQGNLRAETLAGDCLIDDVQGQVELKQVGGDMHLEKIDGGIDINGAGDAMVEFHPVPWQAYQIKANGDISVTMPADSDADLQIQSSSRDITVFPGKLDLVSQEAELEHKLGEGGPAVLLSAAGKVFILDDHFTVMTGFKLNLDDLGDLATGFTTDTSDYIRGSLDHLEEDLRETLSTLSESLEEIGLSEENLANLGVQIEETSRRAAEKAELAAIKAQAKVEKKFAQARRKALAAKEKTKQFDLNKFLETRSKKESVSDSERMLILKMLQEKKISTEEAENLLNALEGK